MIPIRMLRTTAVAAAALGLVLAGSALADPDGLKHESWNWNGNLGTAHKLEINGVNGHIEAEPGTGDHVVITAEKTGRKHDPSVVKIAVHQDSNGIVVCAEYPGESSPCKLIGMGFHDRANDVTVDFHVMVPPGVQFTANTVNGAVHARGLQGPVKAHTVNGACDIETSRSGQASTVNGAVHAAVGRLDPNDELSFSTVNGAITLQLPSNLDAELSSSTVNGNIHTDFPINISSGWGPRSASGRIGKGGARLSAHTVNGSIRFERVNSL